MTIETCRFVHVTELFKELPELLQEFIESEPDFAWGGNEHSLVDGVAIVDHLDNIATEQETQLEELRKRVAELQDDLYVDLEH
jgi:hypothetical protein